MIRLYADENVDRRIVDGLRRRGFDVVTAQAAGLVGRLPDVKHLEFATREGRVLLAADDDLLATVHEWNQAGRLHAGLVYYHQRWTSSGQVVRTLDAMGRALLPDAARNRVFYVPRDRSPRR